MGPDSGIDLVAEEHDGRLWAIQAKAYDGTEVTDARTLAGQIGLGKAMRRYYLRRTISFPMLRGDAQQNRSSCLARWSTWWRAQESCS
jgi:predicted helicase